MPGRNQIFEFLRDYVAYIVFAAVDHVYFGLLHIEAEDFISGFGFFYGERQAYIAQAHYTYHNLFSRNAGK